MKIEVNIFGLDGAVEKLLAMPNEIEKRITDVIEKDLLFVVHRAQEYVDGPRPDRLGIRTGALHASLNENVTVTKVDSQIIGEMGTDVTSKDGFPYPKFWEGLLPREKSKGSWIWPRPFAKPALDDVNDQFISDMQEAVRG